MIMYSGVKECLFSLLQKDDHECFGGGPTGIDGQVCLVCLGRLVCLVLCQQTDKRQTSANGKRIKENRLGFRSLFETAVYSIYI
jgi:hypothetical protein